MPYSKSPPAIKGAVYGVLEGLGADATPARHQNSASPAASFQSLAERNPHIISHDCALCPKAASVYQQQPTHYTPFAGKKTRIFI